MTASIKTESQGWPIHLQELLGNRIREPRIPSAPFQSDRDVALANSLAACFPGPVPRNPACMRVSQWAASSRKRGGCEKAPLAASPSSLQTPTPRALGPPAHSTARRDCSTVVLCHHLPPLSQLVKPFPKLISSWVSVAGKLFFTLSLPKVLNF